MTDSEMPNFDDEELATIIAQIERILGDGPRKHRHVSFHLPIVSPEDVIAFLSGVASGTPADKIPALAEEYAKGHPSFHADHEDWVVIESSPPLPREPA